jgi:hypothetical protein
MRRQLFRLARAVTGLTVITASLAVPSLMAVGARAGTEPTGSLGFLPASGLDSFSLTAVSSGLCSDPRGTNLQLRVTGRGFPAGINVTPNLKAAVYPVDPTTGGYDVPLQDTLRSFAAQQNPPATLSGRYDFTLICKKPWGKGDYGSYTGSLTFSSPTHYRALTRIPEVSTKPATSKPAVPVSSTLPAAVAVSGSTGPGKPVTTAPVSGHGTPQARKMPQPHKSAPSKSPTAGPATSRGAASTASATPGPTTPYEVPTSARAPALVARTAADRLLQRHSGPSPGLVGSLAAASLAVVISLGLVLRRRRRPGAT